MRDSREGVYLPCSSATKPSIGEERRSSCDWSWGAQGGASQEISAQEKSGNKYSGEHERKSEGFRGGSRLVASYAQSLERPLRHLLLTFLNRLALSPRPNFSPAPANGSDASNGGHIRS